MYNSQIIIDRIEQVLRENNVEKKALNEYCEISKNTLNASRTREGGMNAKTLYLIADYLNVSVDWLFGRSDVRSISGGADLSPNEVRLLSAFREMSPEEQYVLIGRAEQEADREKAAKEKEAI